MSKLGQLFVFLLVAFVISFGIGITVRLEMTTLSFLGGAAVGVLLGALVTLVMVFALSGRRGGSIFRPSLSEYVMTPPPQAPLYWTPLIPPIAPPARSPQPYALLDDDASQENLNPSQKPRRFFVIGSQGEESELEA